MAKKLQLRRGTTSQHSSFTGAIGEVTVDTDKKVVVVHDGSTAGGVPLAKGTDIVAVLDEDNMSTDSATRPPSQQSVKAYAQPLDADLTSLAGCQAGAAGAIAALTQAEVEVLDGATVSTAELNLLDGVTSTTAELNYTDGVTSNIQTQLNAKGAGDATLAGTNNWTGAQRGAIDALTSAATITIDMSTGNNHSVTLGHNATFANPSNQVAGQSGSIFITQDGTGSRTGAWGGNFKWKGGTAPILTTTAAAVDRIDYIIAASGSIHAVATLDVK